MNVVSFSLQEDYWNTLNISDSDIEYLYNHLLDVETPLTTSELVVEFISERIRIEKLELEDKIRQGGRIYLPKKKYAEGDSIIFPHLNWEKGVVKNVRAGINPEIINFDVIEVLFPNGITRQFAASLEEHVLNNPSSTVAEDKLLEKEYVYKTFGDHLTEDLEQVLGSNKDIVCIAEHWFPRALLVDVNIGHLNLAEALLDMEGGGPLLTNAILAQIDLPTDANGLLTEFSLNYALHNDGRFDEVGPSGEVLWYLRRLEPEWVQKTPVYLLYHDQEDGINDIGKMQSIIDLQIDDELEDFEKIDEISDDVPISLIYPHWRVGSLPLSNRIFNIFPTALESPRVRFTFVDGNSGVKFSGWVVRKSRYISGLKEWYRSHGTIPGSIIHVRKGEDPGEVVIWVDKRRSIRDWVRTALVGKDGEVVFALLKQTISTLIDERMAFFVPDEELLDKIWATKKWGHAKLETIIKLVMREQMKLNPQGHVHFLELYSGVNLLYRCPPGVIMKSLMDGQWAAHLGDHYFKLKSET
ncbi:MAG: hypothetical protein MUO76_08875 [Anaerolineaceae bacterium]|nr:hypothetical protein [Anaerolineaceae bacterium]